jgi:hypothetical protein
MGNKPSCKQLKETSGSRTAAVERYLDTKPSRVSKVAPLAEGVPVADGNTVAVGTSDPAPRKSPRKRRPPSRKSGLGPECLIPMSKLTRSLTVLQSQNPSKELNEHLFRRRDRDPRLPDLRDSRQDRTDVIPSGVQRSERGCFSV